ncbi:chromosome segregation protein SMC [Methanocella arvoryzae]|uniref:Chromosome partition protein Smc n=1 Tax=Methanocella arvoryzae (strain DSM 22066 / NBRC 105507 / MRE50) TaxID=351160 RepID=Q0W2M0_METAR|nr:chromosome segregation protein SMC [Methanocella arvoryzae]CAJ37373.1 chromosome segregation/partition protein [Methanocella arvoryzae MRE50]
MHIKEIELSNFKSFARKVKVPFYDDFTTISGPNGSGKSNIIDSILFCLGLSNSRTMRAEKLTDLIYSVDGKSPGTAEVTIRFDNVDRELPIDLDEITVTRRIKSSDSGYYSYYYFNDKPSSLNEIHEQLAKARISQDGYNVVLQGDVTRIISMSDTERRKIIDEIAGTAEFDDKTDKALSELEVVRERIERVNIIIAEVEARLSQLKRERDQALLYQSYRDEKIKNEGYLLLSELKEARKSLDSLLEDLRDKTAKREAIIAEVEAKVIAVDKLKAEIRALSEVITSKGEGEQIKIRREIEEDRAGIKACTNIIEFSKSETVNREKEKQKLFLEIEASNTQIEALGARVAEEEQRKASLVGELKHQKAALEEVHGKIMVIDSRFEGVRSRLSEMKNALEASRNQRNEKIREKDRILDAARRKQDEEMDAEAAITSGRSEIESLRVEGGNIERDIKELQRRSQALVSDIADMESARARAKQDQLAIESKLRKLQEEYARAEGRIKAYEESDYSQAVETILQARNTRELPGIYGTIAELGKVDDSYSTALEVAAGNRLQNIVVDNDEDASRCIYYLKDRRKGTATFLPLNKMRQRPPMRDFKNQPGVIDYAINLVDYNPKYDAAFWYVFGDTLVVDSLETARRMIGSVRMVTLDGDLVEKSGAMTGGFRQKSKLKFKASEEERIRTLAEQITVAESERDMAISKVESVDGHIYSLKKDRSELESQIQKLSSRRDEIAARAGRLEITIREKEAAIASLRDERRMLRDDMIQIEDAIAKADADIISLSSETAKLEDELKGSEIPKLTEEATRIEEEMRRLEDRIRDIESGIASTKMEQGFVTARIEENRKRLQDIDANIVALRQKVTENEAQIVVHQQRMAELGKREKEIEAELVGLKKQRDEMSEALTRADHDLYDARRSLERVTGLLNTLEIARDENIEKIRRMEATVQERGVVPSEDVPPIDKVRANISLLERKMQELEPVNMLAITEYDSVEARLKETTEKRDILTRERQDILDKIEHYKTMKKEAFMTTFTAIADNFRNIFHELSDGVGELVLENPEDPFAGGLTIHAQPHGKALQRMEAMSGGEKSLTALAFIFSIQRHRPAPFYAFDEVDMFLDGANAERVARMIKSLSSNAQFIVVSLRKPMIESANRTIGIAMQENNISSITGVRLYGN